MNGSTSNFLTPMMKSRLFAIGDLFLLFVIALLMTILAVQIRPVWDDAIFDMLEWDNIPLRPNMGDRPLVGAIWEFLSRHGLLWQASYLLHWLAWFATGVTTMYLWRMSFPTLCSFSVVAGTLAMSPILCKVQYVLLTTMLTSHIPVLIVYLAYFLAFIAEKSTLAFSKRFLLKCFASSGVLLGTFLSEYAVAAGLACLVLLYYNLRYRFQKSLKLTFTRLALALGILAIGYLLFRVTRNPDVRPEVHPELVMTRISLTEMLKVVSASLVSNLWAISLGEILSGLGSLRIISTIPGLITYFAGLVLGALLVVRTFFDYAKQSSFVVIHSTKARPILILLLAVTAGLLPVLVMRPSIYISSTGTRLWLPVLPIASCLGISLMHTVLSRKWLWLIAFLTGILTFHSIAWQYKAAKWLHDHASAWSPQIRTMLSPSGINVAVFLCSDRTILTHLRWVELYDYELTARLTMYWSPSERQRFWAFPRPPDTLDSKKVVDLTLDQRDFDDFFSLKKIQFNYRGVERSGLVNRLILVKPEKNGTIGICILQNPNVEHESN